jgi:taurine--2-oxoglutarate transaminase
MTDHAYFFTWTAQKKALKIPLEKSGQFHFTSGNKDIIDMSSLSYQASFGLRNQKITRAMKKQMELFSLASPKHTFALKQRVSDRLCRKASQLPSKKRDYRCFFTQSGSESVENALKMARQITGKNYILCQQNSYHGSTLGALSATGDWRNQNHLSLSQYTLRIPGPLNDPMGSKIEAIIKKNIKKGIAAFCLETITGGNGVIIPSIQWYAKVQDLCKKYKILLILDEVVCGAHRTGPFFGHQNYRKLKPDFICLAKAITGGYFPMGAVLVKEKLAKYYHTNTLSCGLTNYGHPLGLAAVDAVMDITEQVTFQKKLNRNIKELTLFKERLLSCSHILNVRQVGLLMAVETSRPFKTEDFLENGIFVAVQKGAIIIAPALTMPTKTLKEGLEVILQTTRTKS